KQGFPGTVTAGKRKTGVTRLLLERGDQIRTEGAVAPAAVGGAIVIGSPATRTGRTVVGCRVLNGEYVFGRIRVVKIVVRSQDVIRIVDHIASQVRGLSVFPTVQVQTGHQRAGSPLRSASTCHFSRSELACCQQVGQGFLQIGEDLLMHFVYGSAGRIGNLPFVRLQHNGNPQARAVIEVVRLTEQVDQLKVYQSAEEFRLCHVLCPFRVGKRVVL